MNTKELQESRKALFFTDLDNTLIYSHRHQISDPAVWVEELNGRRQSFMSRRSFDYFKTQEWLEVIPTTMRTPEQYGRLLSLGNTLGWHLALVCNGAVLLVDGKEDLSWREESLRLSENDQPAYEEVLRKAFAVYERENIVSVDRIMFYIKGTEVDRTYSYLREHADPEHVFVYKDSRKVYCLPMSLCKGCAVRRIKAQRDDSLLCIAAGDGPSDVGMLEQADICLCPRALDNAVTHAGDKILCEGFFADSICRELENIRMGEFGR